MIAAIFSGGVLAAMVRLVCPHCREVQVRARKRRRAVYVCRKCRKHFTREGAEDSVRVEAVKRRRRGAAR